MTAARVRTVSDLPRAGVLDGTEKIPADQQGSTVSITAAQIAALVPLPAPLPALPQVSLATVAALRAFLPAGMTSGATAFSAGYFMPADGGGGVFSWVPGSTAADDGAMVIKPTDVTGAGRWLRLLNGAPLTPAMCGATGVGNEASILLTAFSRGVPVLIPKGKLYEISTDIIVPDGAVIQLDGTLIGYGVIEFAGSVTMTGSGSIGLGAADQRGWTILRVHAGTVILRDFAYRPVVRQTAVRIQPSSAGIDSLEISGLRITGAGFAILRDDVGGAVRSAILTRNVIRDGAGDGIEWNVGNQDRRLIITENRIDNLSASDNLANTFAGIGIGVAGTINAAEANYENFPAYQREFIIANNVLTRMRQGIHVEYAGAFSIYGNKLSEIRGTYGPATGLDLVAIVAYGSEAFTVSDNLVTDSDAGYWVEMRYTNGAYVGSSREFVFQNNTAVRAGNSRVVAIPKDVTKPVYSVIRGNNFILSTLNVFSGGHVTLDSNTVQAPWGAIGFNYRYRTPTYNPFNPDYRALVRITNNNSSDPIGRASASVVTGEQYYDTINMIVEAHGNNFAVPGPDPTAPSPMQRSIMTNAGTFPYGVEFQRGDNVVDTSTGVGAVAKTWVVTASGSRTKPGDTYAIVSAAAGTIKASAGQAWSRPGFHSVGQAITLTDGASVVKQGIVAKIYYSGDADNIDLIDGATGLPLNLGALASGTITATNPVGYAGP